MLEFDGMSTDRSEEAEINQMRKKLVKSLIDLLEASHRHFPSRVPCGVHVLQAKCLHIAPPLWGN